MADSLTPERRSKLMSRVRGQETIPEKRVRSILHRLGFRFRKNVKSLPGTPDIVLPKYKTAIFVHGCFWHQHNGCRKARRPTTRVEFWNKKFDANIERDARKLRELRKAGWKTLVIWQCQIKDSGKLERKLGKALLKIVAR